MLGDRMLQLLRSVPYRPQRHGRRHVWFRAGVPTSASVRSFDQLEAAVEAGKDVARAAYPPDPARSANTSRHVSAALYASAKRGLDPMNLLPPGSFGRELAMAALAGYLKLVS